MERWVGKVALVTGASVGMGACIAQRLARAGMTVVGCARNAEKIEALSSGLDGASGSLHPVSCDLRSEQQILDMFAHIREKFGGVDVCVNNAGLGRKAPVIDGKTEDWREMLDVNVLALSICTREALKSIKERNVIGHIIHISSLGGHMIPQAAESHWYTATKWMVRTLTECLRMELREQKSRTRVTEISPGLVKTEFALRMRGEEVGNRMYETRETLTADQVTDAVMFALSAAENMEVNDILMRPTSEG